MRFTVRYDIYGEGRAVGATTREIYHQSSTLEKQATDMGIFDTTKRAAMERKYTVDDTVHSLENAH